MKLIQVTPDNLEKEHICCALSSDKDEQVLSKKAWLAERLKDGLVFLKGDVRGKCFIEYLPAEQAWAPVQADGYMFINCLWVSGQYKGQGNSSLLLNECIRDSKEKGKLGLCVISSAKKRPFLSDPKYLRHKGFIKADTACQDFELYYFPFAPGAPMPAFRPAAKKAVIERQGVVLYYTHQCPFTAKYVPLAAETAQKLGLPFTCVLISSAEEAQNVPAPVTSYALFYNGRFITNEILSAAKLEHLVQALSEEGNYNNEN